MPRRKTAKDTTKNRTNVPVPLTPRANQAVNDWCDRTGGSKAKLIELLAEWFAAAPESMQQVITNNIARDLRPAYIARAKEWFDSMLEEKTVVDVIVTGTPGSNASKSSPRLARDETPESQVQGRRR